MSYVLKSSSRGKNRFPLPLRIVLGILAILIVCNLLFPKVLSNLFVALARPFWNLEETVQNGGVVVSVADLIKENNELKQVAATHEAEYQEIDLLQKENSDLKAILNRLPSQHTVLAQILKKPPYSPYDVFIIDIGKDAGVLQGDKVYALGNIPIGEIAEVDGNTSKVMLYSSSGQKFNVLLGTSTLEAVATGKGGGSFEAMVPRDSKVAVGENVLIPNLNNAFVGKIQNIVSIPSDPFSTVLFNQPINLFEMRWVLVDISHTNENK